MPCFVLSTGIFLTFKTRFLQFRAFPASLKYLSQGQPEGKGVSSFSALTTALAGSVGIGSIVGVATAVSLGGPGAVFWMLIFALAGMIIKYAEIFLAIKYRYSGADGHPIGGPMFYLRDGAKKPFFAYFYALAAVLASFGIGNLCQSNSAATVLSHEFGAPKWLTGALLSLFCGIIILRGLRGITKFTSIAIPIIDTLFLLFGIFAILSSWHRLPDIFSSILKDAFQPAAAGGGLLGSLISPPMRYGVSRGIFSSEAGLGSASIVHAASQGGKPEQHALLGILEVFISSVLACIISAIVLLLSDAQGLEGAAYASAAYEAAFPGFGGYFVVIMLCLFAFLAPLSWSIYGECGLNFLLGRKFSRKFQLCYQILFVLALFLGATVESRTVWALSDILNALMALPNLVALLLLSGEIPRSYKKTGLRQHGRSRSFRLSRRT